MKRVLYPGSFDPITNGHVDVIERILNLYDDVTIAVLKNEDKRRAIPVQDRIKLIKQSINNKNVKVESFSGLTVDYAKKKGINLIVRGIRAASDFEYELEMSQINYFLSQGIDTVFLMTNPKYSFIRSSRVKEVASLGGNIKNLVPLPVYKYFLGKKRQIKKILA